MIDFSAAKNISNNDPGLPVHIYMPFGIEWRPAIIDRSKIYYLTPKGADQSWIVMTGGEEIMVDMPVDALDKMLRYPDFRSDKIDLLPYTGADVVQASCRRLFNEVSIGHRGDNSGFKIKAYFHTACEQLIEEYSLRFIDASGVDHLQEGNKDVVYKTYLGGPDLYIDIPCKLMRQFMTHAHKERVDILDLSELSNPHIMTQQKKDMLLQMPQVYVEDVFRYKPFKS